MSKMKRTNKGSAPAAERSTVRRQHDAETALPAGADRQLLLVII